MASINFGKTLRETKINIFQADKYYSLNSDVLAAMIAASPKEEQERQVVAAAAERRIDNSLEQDQRTAKSVDLNVILERSQELGDILGKPQELTAAQKTAKAKEAATTTTTTTTLAPPSLSDLVGRPIESTTASPLPLTFEAVPSVPAAVPEATEAVPATGEGVGEEEEELEEDAEELGSAEEGEEEDMEGSGYKRK